MFYKKGIDITNDKQMFNFLHNHFEYYIMNSWNRLTSIANKVKLHSLKLSGDWCVTQSLLENGEYETVRYMIEKWENEHPSYKVFFNGRSGGYLVLCSQNSNGHILPEEILEAEDYGEYKRFCKEFYGSVQANRDELRFYTRLVQDFDKLCDELRDFCDELSQQKFEVIEMEKAVEQFNETYEADLEYLGFDALSCDGEGRVDISEIEQLDCLAQAFFRIADRRDSGYTLHREQMEFVRYMRTY